MDKTEFPVYTLPDIEMYGGDTVPWEVTLVRDDGCKYTIDDAKNFTCTLTITPFKVTTGLGGRASPVMPVLTKSGSLQETLDESAIVIFLFDIADTIGLRGKFLYQIEVACGTDLRAAQGHLYIKQNIRR